MTSSTTTPMRPTPRRIPTCRSRSSFAAGAKGYQAIPAKETLSASSCVKGPT